MCCNPLFNIYAYRATSITPGTVLIILAGRFKGKRVIFLKQLSSGLLLATGPFKINGVPLRRVNQSYLIATSTMELMLINSMTNNLPSKLRRRKRREKASSLRLRKRKKKVFPREKKDDQKGVDAPLIKSIEGVPDLKAYLAARFSLKAAMDPYELVF